MFLKNLPIWEVKNGYSLVLLAMLDFKKMLALSFFPFIIVPNMGSVGRLTLIYLLSLSIARCLKITYFLDWETYSQLKAL